MKIYGKLNMQQNVFEAAGFEELSAFPDNPVPGRIIFKDKHLWACLEITNGVPAWVPMTDQIQSVVQSFDNQLSVTVPHTFGQNVIVQLYDGASRMITPDFVDTTASDKVIIRFAIEQTGRVVVLSGGSTMTNNTFAPYAHVGAGDGAHALATSILAGFMSPDHYSRVSSLPIGVNVADGLVKLTPNTQIPLNLIPVVGAANGLMIPEDKSKLNGIADGANNYTLPSATASALGGVIISTDSALQVTNAGALSVVMGSTVGTVVAGNDARVTADGAADAATIRTIGTGSNQAAAGNHTHAAPTVLSVTGLSQALSEKQDRLGFTPVNTAALGAANGVATLDTYGKVLTAQLPSYVDDVVEGADLAAFPTTGESGKIYVALNTNKTYRWSGSTYVYITSGAVDSVAGKTGVVTLAKSDVGLSLVDNTSDANKPVSIAQAAANAQVLGSCAPIAHVGAGGAVHSVAIASGASGFMSGPDKAKLDSMTFTGTAGSIPLLDASALLPVSVVPAIDASRTFYASAMTIDGGFGIASGTTLGFLETLDFSGSTQGSASFCSPVHPKFDASALRLWWSAQTSGTGNILLSIDVWTLLEGEAPAHTQSYITVPVTPSNFGMLSVTTLVSNLPKKDLMFRITRVAADPADTYTGSLQLIKTSVS